MSRLVPSDNSSGRCRKVLDDSVGYGFRVDRLELRVELVVVKVQAWVSTRDCIAAITGCYTQLLIEWYSDEAAALAPGAIEAPDLA
jgi:hypothetical protein